MLVRALMLALKMHNLFDFIMKSNLVCLMISYEISSILSRLIAFPKDFMMNEM